MPSQYQPKMKIHTKMLMRVLPLVITALFVIQIFFYCCIKDESSSLGVLFPVRARSDAAVASATARPQDTEGESVSACLLIRDDNHFLIEWIAYYYHVLPLRHLIVAVDPNSVTSPREIFDRWSNLVTIEEWNESRYVPDNFEHHYVDKSLGFSHHMKQHRARQQLFNIECLKHLKKLDKGWTMVVDTDEYVTVNPLMYNTSFHGYDPNIKLQGIQTPGSVLSFLQQLVIPNPRFRSEIETPCVTIARKQFSAHDSHIDSSSSLFNVSHFQTLRWLKTGFKPYKAFNGSCIVEEHVVPSKSMIDLSRLRLVDIGHPDNKGNPHRPLEAICGSTHAQYTASQTALVAHHYMGTYEQWMSRMDARGQHMRLARFEYLQTRYGNEENVDLVPWLQGFVENVGTSEAVRLLTGAGQVETKLVRENIDALVTTDEPVYKTGDKVQVNFEGLGEWLIAEVAGSHRGGYYDVVFQEDVVEYCSEEIAVGSDRIRRIEGIQKNAWVYNATINDAKTTVYVISLQDVPGAAPENAGRLDSFRNEWNDICGPSSIQFRHCPGVVDSRRGFGLTQSFAACFDQAMEDAQGVSLFFEDDARLFDSKFCDQKFRRSLWEKAPADVMLIMLGGHDWKFGHTNGSDTFRETTFSYGSYGFAVPLVNLKALRDGYAAELKGDADFLAPDKSWYRHAWHLGKKVYKISPLVVWHKEGFSNSWGGFREAIKEDGPPKSKVYSELAVGQEVEVRGGDEGFFPAIVARLNPDQTFDIDFVGGGARQGVSRGEIRAASKAPTSLSAGQQVFALTTEKSTVYYPANIERAYKVEKFDIAFDGGSTLPGLWRHQISDVPEAFSELSIGDKVVVPGEEEDDYCSGTGVVEQLYQLEEIVDVKCHDEDGEILNYVLRKEILKVDETHSDLSVGQRVTALWDIEYRPGTVARVYDTFVYDLSFGKGPIQKRSGVPSDQIRQRRELKQKDRQDDDVG